MTRAALPRSSIRCRATHSARDTGRTPRACFARVLAGCFGVLAALPPLAYAEATRVEVRVLSQGAKFIGDGTGGARVRLVDVATGNELARGVTQGGTGDTDRIMKACGREPDLGTPEAAAFRTEVDIDVPTLVRAEVEGPLGLPHVQARITAERWLLPGLGTGSGDGWVLELPGVAVSIREPREGTVIVAGETGAAEAAIEADVMMLCGCPLTLDGLWDANEQQIEVMAVGPHGSRAGPYPLAYAGQPNRFAGRLQLPSTGGWSVIVTAFNRRTGTTGVARLPVSVVKAAGSPH